MGLRLRDESVRHNATEAEEEGTAGDYRSVLELRTHRRRNERPIVAPQEGHIVFATVAGLRLIGGADRVLSGCTSTIADCGLPVHRPHPRPKRTSAFNLPTLSRRPTTVHAINFDKDDLRRYAQPKRYHARTKATGHVEVTVALDHMPVSPGQRCIAHVN
jgi:hypothetical protein